MTGRTGGVVGQRAGEDGGVTAEEVQRAERAVRVPGTRWIIGGIAAVLVAAVCMRPALTAVGPVLGLIGADTGLSNTMLGLLSALPLLAFAAVSPIVHGPVRRIGIERTVAWALAALAAGSAFRALPGRPELWIGTAVAGAGIAVCNVLIPVVIRRDHPARVPLMTALYSATMGTAAALASGVSQPLSHLPGSWRLSLGIWAVPAAVAAVVWLLRRSRATPEPEPDLEDPTPVWRSVGAWRLTAVMGLQSTTFYIMVAWLPSIATSHGASDALGGWYLFAYQAIGILAGLGLPAVLHRAGTPRAGILVSAPLVVACLGIITLPAALPAWVLLAGISSGSALVYALTRISLAAHTSAHATRLSGMAQSIGYLVAASGPVVVGWLRDSTGSWTPALAFVAALATVQATAAALRLRAP
jgi:MFS transporter, CP family, cyanate transporter